MYLNLVLFVLLNTFFRCSSSVHLTSKITPRCVWQITPGYVIMNGKYLRSLGFILIRIGVTMHVLSFKNRPDR